MLLSIPQEKIVLENDENIFDFSEEELMEYLEGLTVQELEVMANAIKSYDIIAIQEVVAGYGGSQAVSRLVSILNTKDSKWDYTISDPTTSSNPSSQERYAFIWKTSKVKKIGKAWLEKKYHLEIDREPYFCTFQFENKHFTVVNFHAITKKMQPETEIKYFKFFMNLHHLSLKNKKSYSVM